MRIANLAGRLSIVIDELAVDVAEASDNRFAPEVQDVYERFDEFREWVASTPLPIGRSFSPAQLGAPAPQPRQLFAIGLNYSEHAKESGFAAPPSPAVFTKFATSITGPYGDVALPHGNIDWEVELVAVIGKQAFQVREDDAWSHVA